MNAAEFIRSRLRKLETQMDEHAHAVAGGGKGFEDYLIGVGKYRQMRAERDGLTEQLKRLRDPVEDTEPDEIVDEEETPATPPAPRRAKARGWGGR